MLNTMTDDDRDEEPRPPEEALFEGMEILNGGRPPKVTPEQGLAMMRERLESLNRQLDHLCSDDTARAGSSKTLARYALIDQVTKEITDTKNRIAEYEAQLRSGNN